MQRSKMKFSLNLAETLPKKSMHGGKHYMNGKKALVCGAGGFIGHHLVKRLKSEGYWVRGVDLKYPQFGKSQADDFVIGDLRMQKLVAELFKDSYHEVYQLAADMGGAGFIFTGENDANLMSNSAMINLNIVQACTQTKVGRVFFSSSACMYPAHNQEDPNNPNCEESTAYPANPDSEYGWEKLFSERLYLAFHKNYGLEVRIGRFHNIFGQEGTWEGGREKAPAALCRKVAESTEGGTIEIWGDGKQTRTFLYIDECIEGVRRLMKSNFTGPVNIGSEELISINDLAKLIMKVSGKKVNVKNIPGPTGVRGRSSDNKLIQEKLGWSPSQPLETGIKKTYQWISEQVGSRVKKAA
jgi:nucleoside-diphosphate-sugar epimerase